jgi:hypothetical protein
VSDSIILTGLLVPGRIRDMDRMKVETSNAGGRRGRGRKNEDDICHCAVLLCAAGYKTGMLTACQRLVAYIIQTIHLIRDYGHSTSNVHDKGLAM